jgi:hypothetical protein
MRIGVREVREGMFIAWTPLIENGGEACSHPRVGSIKVATAPIIHVTRFCRGVTGHYGQLSR